MLKYFANSWNSVAVKLNSSFFWVITRCEIVWNRRFETTYMYHLNGSSCPRRTTWSLRVVRIGTSETSVLNHLMLCNNLEDGRILIVTLFTVFVCKMTRKSMTLARHRFHVRWRQKILSLCIFPTEKDTERRVVTFVCDCPATELATSRKNPLS